MPQGPRELDQLERSAHNLAPEVGILNICQAGILFAIDLYPQGATNLTAHQGHDLPRHLQRRARRQFVRFVGCSHAVTLAPVGDDHIADQNGKDQSDKTQQREKEPL